MWTADSDVNAKGACIGHNGQRVRAITTELNGEKIYHYPASLKELEACKPIYETMEGWSGSTVGVTDYDKLPAIVQQLLAE